MSIDFAHNDYVQGGAETGLAGAGLVVLATAIFFRLAFHNLSWRLESGHGWVQLGEALGCCGLLVHNFSPRESASFAALAPSSSHPAIQPS